MASPEVLSLNRVIQIAPESVAGTAVPALYRLQSFNGTLDAQERIQAFLAAGNQYPSSGSLSPEGTSGNLTMQPDYEELLFPLKGLFGAGNVALTSGKQIAHDWTWDLAADVLDTPVTYSVEQGNAETAEKFAYGVFSGLTMNLSRQTVTGGATLMGQGMDNTGALTTITPNDDVQTVTITGGPTGGTFTLTFRGATTAGIAYNATNAAVQAALVALSTIGAGNVAVTGSAGGPYTVTFQGGLSDQLMPAMTASGASLTGGTTPAVGVVHSTPGVSATLAPNTQPLQGSEVNVYLDTSAGSLGSTQALLSFSANLTVADKYQGAYPLDRAIAGFAAATPRAPRFELVFGNAQDATGRGLLTSLRAHQRVYVRLEAIGNNIESGAPYAFIVDLSMEVTQPGRGTDVNGIFTRAFTLSLFADHAWGKSAHLLLRNTRAAI